MQAGLGLVQPVPTHRAFALRCGFLRLSAMPGQLFPHADQANICAAHRGPQEVQEMF